MVVLCICACACLYVCAVGTRWGNVRLRVALDGAVAAGAGWNATEPDPSPSHSLPLRLLVGGVNYPVRLPVGQSQY